MPVYSFQNKRFHYVIRTMEVIGEGRVMGAFDRAEIIFGIITGGRDLHPVQSENSEITGKVIQTLLNEGIRQTDIQTAEYRIERRFDYIDGKQIFKGYEVRHLLKVINHVIERTGLIVDRAVASGANALFNITFGASNKDYIYLQALIAAIQNANQKAGAMAKTLGSGLQPVPINIKETVLNRAVPLANAVMEAVSETTPIQPGELEVAAKVTVEYAY